MSSTRRGFLWMVRERTGVLGMKSMGGKAASVVITGIDAMPIVDQAIAALRTWRQLDAQRMAALEARTATLAASGRYEPFKTGTRFGGTAQHPEWLG